MNQNFGSFNWTEVFPLMFRSTQTTSRSVTIRRTYQNTCTRMAFWNSNELWMNMYLEDAEIFFYYEESWNFRHTKIRMWLDTHLEPQCPMSPSTAFYPCIACTPDKFQMPGKEICIIFGTKVNKVTWKLNDEYSTVPKINYQAFCIKKKNSRMLYRFLLIKRSAGKRP